jgi:hypothetical protein
LYNVASIAFAEIKLFHEEDTLILAVVLAGAAGVGPIVLYDVNGCPYTSKL